MGKETVAETKDRWDLHLGCSQKDRDMGHGQPNWSEVWVYGGFFLFCLSIFSNFYGLKLYSYGIIF